MEEPLITFPVAQLAKEKGFTEACIYYFYQCEKDPVEEKGSVLDGRADWGELDFLDNVYWSRPTQALLAKWLREVHHIHLRIQAVLKPNLLYQVDRVYLNSPQHNVGANITFPRHEWSGEYTTYEEAVEKGLAHALSALPK